MNKLGKGCGWESRRLWVLHKGEVGTAEPCPGTELLARVGGGERPPLSQRCPFLCKGALIWPVTSELAMHQPGSVLRRAGRGAHWPGECLLLRGHYPRDGSGWLATGPGPQRPQSPRRCVTECRGCGCCEGGMLRGPALLLGASGAPGPQTKPPPPQGGSAAI